MPLSRTLAPSVEDILDAVISVYDIDRSALFKSRRGEFNEPRNVAIYLFRYLRGETLLSIGKHFGLTRYSSVNSVISRVQALRENNKNIEIRIKKINTDLNKSQEAT